MTDFRKDHTWFSSSNEGKGIKVCKYERFSTKGTKNDVYLSHFQFRGGNMVWFDSGSKQVHVKTGLILVNDTGGETKSQERADLLSEFTPTSLN